MKVLNHLGPTRELAVTAGTKTKDVFGSGNGFDLGSRWTVSMETSERIQGAVAASTLQDLVKAAREKVR